MLKRLIKMITKVKDDFRVKRARTAFENRRVKNQRVAQYQHKKMLEISKLLRERLSQTTNSSGDEYFAILKEIHTSRGRTVYGGVVKKTQKRTDIRKEGDSNARHNNGK